MGHFKEFEFCSTMDRVTLGVRVQIGSSHSGVGSGMGLGPSVRFSGLDQFCQVYLQPISSENTC